MCAARGRLHFPLIQPHLDEKSPSYICFKLDTPGWLFVAYVPDFSKVRDKMLYASTRTPLKKCLGEPHFVDEIYGLDKVRSSALALARVARANEGASRPQANRVGRTMANSGI